MPKTTSNVPKAVRLFTAHGVDFLKTSSREWVGRCIFCDSEKFHCDSESSRWDCKKCLRNGNNYEFLRQLHEVSFASMKPLSYVWLSSYRGLSESALRAWGVCRSFVTNEWIVPGYGASGGITQLYRYMKTGTKSDGSPKFDLLPSPGFDEGKSHGVLLPVMGFDDTKPNTDICEGVWDAIAWHDALGNSGRGLTTNVIGVPGCGVFNESWVRYTNGRHITFLYDNDHPQTNPQTGAVSQPGLSGTKRASNIVSGVSRDDKPQSVSWLDWGGNGSGYDKDLKSGYDIRDTLADGTKCEDLLALVKPVPSEWGVSAQLASASVPQHVTPLACRSWEELTNAWKLAAKWGDGLDGMLAVCLASIASVTSGGAQLWLMCMSPSGTYKSEICKAFAVAHKYVIEDSGTNGFFSGFKDAKKGEKQEDYSLAGKLNRKTLVTKEAATLVKHPNVENIIADALALSDGSIKKPFKNGLNWSYEDWRWTWIIAGTYEMRALDRTALGSRFICYSIMKEIEPEYEDEIMDRALMQQMNASHVRSNCKPGSSEDPDYLRAKRLTGGYIEYLRTGLDTHELDVPDLPDEDIARIKKLAAFVEYMRCRPSATQEELTSRALSVRIGKQLIKLAQFLCVVKQKSSIDKSIRDIIEKVALDTSDGATFDIVRALAECGEYGLELKSLAPITKKASVKIAPLLEFLGKIKVVEQFIASDSGYARTARFRLTPGFAKLYSEVMR